MVGRGQDLDGLEPSILAGLWTADPRFRKAFPAPSSSLLRLTGPNENQELGKTRTLAGIGWNEVAVSTK
jgi:hypothetical protein